jgi:hypothetical protein
MAHRPPANAGVVVALAIVGMYAGALVTERIAMPCHCDDPETIIAGGGFLGAFAGAAIGVALTR